MKVTGIDLAPGVDDGDNRLAQDVGRGEAQLPQTRAVTESAHRVRTEPAGASQFLFQVSSSFLKLGFWSPAHRRSAGI